MSQSGPQSDRGCLLNATLLVCAVCGFAIFVCWTGCTGFYLFNLGKLSYEITEQVKELPEMQDHIGDIQSHFISPDAAQEAQQRRADFDIALDIQGTKGRGILLVRVDQNDKVRSATLHLPSGDDVVVVEE